MGASRETNIERATPECATPEQLSVYVRASEQLLIDIVGNYLATESENIPGELRARIQRRVVDSSGSRKACHDSFGVSPESKLGKANHLPPPALAHLATRSFITGAGYVRGSGLRYAQKIGGLRMVNGYGYFGSMYRTTKSEGTPRIEARCSDINISDWATTMRVGGMAIAIALNQTPLADTMVGLFPEEAIWQAKDCNRVNLNRDGSFQSSWEQQFAVDFQQGSAELAMTKLLLHCDEVPPELFKIAKEIYDFCDDYRKVLKGEATIDLLADRADWAAKFATIQRGVVKDRKFGIKRKLTDVISRAADMRYDYIGMSAIDGQLMPISYGTGYKLRERGVFNGKTITAEDVSLALRRPPANTRAALRSSLIRRYNVTNCDWNSVQVVDGDIKHVISFEDVLQTELSDADHAKLADVKQLRS